jgi:hypothetical protein
MLYIFGIIFTILAFKGMDYPVACTVYTVAAVICAVFGSANGFNYARHKDAMELMKEEKKNEEV